MPPCITPAFASAGALVPEASPELLAVTGQQGGVGSVGDLGSVGGLDGAVAVNAMGQACMPGQPCPPSPRVPHYWLQACRDLAACDPVMPGLIARFPQEMLTARSDAAQAGVGRQEDAMHHAAFITLARSIVGQQISVQAAAAVWGRLQALLPNMATTQWLNTPAPALRSTGLSARKVEYLTGLARHCHEGRLRVQHWAGMDDEAVIRELTAIRGIGRWTAQMFLIFHLLRPDVLPLDDVGLLRGIGQCYLGGPPAQPQAAQAVAEAWKPWRSVGTWYIWRSLDPLPVAY